MAKWLTACLAILIEFVYPALLFPAFPDLSASCLIVACARHIPFGATNVAMPRLMSRHAPELLARTCTCMFVPEINMLSYVINAWKKINISRMRAALPDQCKQKKKKIKINSNFIFNYDLNYSSLLFFLLFLLMQKIIMMFLSSFSHFFFINSEIHSFLLKVIFDPFR